MKKQQLRKQYKALRAQVEEKEAKSATICQRLLTSDSYRQAQTIALYAALPAEADPAALLQSALRDGKRVCLPKVIGDTMAFYAVNEDTAMVNGAFGILEPQQAPLVPPADIDLIIVPLLAADKAHTRLGMGGGYYDRYLAAFDGTAIGIGFQAQISQSFLPREQHDIRLNSVCTENGWM